ncbi:odorant receptor 43b-like [Rhopalosiphum maidis]|uniref:odorant receptor 43b-like n=1 Tax=Rhopalosiphum maidis TaxID=43146 RepID=UPI000F005BC2|nr:odorant receptor 43b-like [Rhopalosiphum maidis]XP_026805470.1 odorant receptor 43b-like [Rhopalosiphum maidis]
MAHIIDTYFKKAGCSDEHGYDTMCMVYFTYCELAVTLFLMVSTSLLIADSAEDLSVRAYGVLCFTIEFIIFSFIIIRYYSQSQFRDMYQRSRGARIPENFKQKITIVIKHHLIMPNLFAVISVLYTISSDAVQIGDQFTFPLVDVLPIKTTNVSIYVCKYILYALPVYFAYIEVSFLNVTYMYSMGILQTHFQILDAQVKESMTNMDEHKLKIAIKHHQEMLKFFKTMKTVFEKPIFLFMVSCGLFIGLTSCLIVQVIQGFIHRIILGLCLISSLEGFLTIIIYCVYASNLYNLHDGILNGLFEHRLFYSRKKSFNHLILIMMNRASIPLVIKAGSIFTVNLNLLIRILRFAYTVLNVLLTSINHHLIKTN